MNPAVLFLGSAAIAAVLLVGVVMTGRAARRRAHLTLVALTLVALATAVLSAERLGAEYDIEGAGWITPVHLWIAHLTVVGLLLPVGSGLLTLKRPRTRRLHGRRAFVALAMTMLSAVTGAWMLLAADKI